MRINRLKLQAQQRAMQAANRSESLELQSAVAELARAVSGFQAAVVAKKTGAPVATTAQAAVNELAEVVADVVEEVKEKSEPPSLILPES